MVIMKDKIWVTWEDHRRSRELAKAFSADYVCLTHPGRRPVRYTILTFKTIFTLLKRKPEIVFCQNPSIILNSLLCFLKPFFKYKIISDRHSNFKFHTLNSKNSVWKIFHLLSEYTLRKSEITIITNEYLKNYVNTQGGNAYILPDKLPSFERGQKIKLQGNLNYVFVCTYSEDEPVMDILDAARKVDSHKHIYITGNYKKYSNRLELERKKPDNVTLTGFLAEDDYQKLINSADVLIVITDQEYTLTCGAYEAVSLEKPMILGKTTTIKNYFSQGALYTDSSASDLAEKINSIGNNYLFLENQVKSLKLILNKNWFVNFNELEKAIKSL
ncbi:glycosyltransferase [Cellvibrio polysaccharolyticus]|uniref:glycosyltransferase n=1 Tax=Cellvibrio polysaccharolyticus TaxID=2082724 RepID=UPI002E2C9483|nr:glycosyltransferase [Cellvibrio polysaccharolyticus]